MPTAPSIQQPTDISIAKGNQSGTAYQIDLHSAIEACKQAQICLKNNKLDDCEPLVIKALMHRPACDLAYKILSQLSDRRGQAEDSVECRNRRLPEWLHEKYFGCYSPLESTDSATDAIDRLVVVESERVSIPAPLSLHDQPAPPFRRTEILSNTVFIDTIENATIWHDSSNTLVLDSNGAMVAEHSVGNAQLLVALTEACTAVAVPGRLVLLGARGAHNYYHWLLDIIPKLNVLRDAGFECRADDTFVVPHAKPGFARALLAQYGVAAKQIFEAELVSPYLFAEQLIVPRLRNTMGYSMGSWLPGALQRSMLQQAPSELQSNRKIYVSRDEKTAAGRTVGNQQDVEVFFARCGFEIVFPERYSVLEQAQLFASARVVAGPHGAGLSNLVYCAPGTKVVEFFGEHMAPCYWAISALAGLEYYQHYDIKNDPPGRRSSSDNRRAAGFDIPVQSAEALLQKASVI